MAHPTADGIGPLGEGAGLADDLLRVGSALLRATGYFLFFLMLFVPTAYQPLKGILLAVVVTGILAAALLGRRFPLDPGVALAALGFAAIGLIFVLEGLAAGAPGAMPMLNVYVVWPLVYTWLAVGASYPGVLDALTRVTVYSGLAISFYSIIYVLWAAGLWPDALYYAFDQGQAIGFHGTYIEFALYSTTTLLYLVPYLVGALFVFPRQGAPVSRRLLWLTMIFSLTTVLLSGRRALLLLVPVAPVLALLFRSWLPSHARRESRRMVRRVWWSALVLTVLLVVIMTALGGLVPTGFVDMVASGFRFNSDVVAMSRRDQFLALISGWLQQPVFGSGHGAPAPGVIRSVEMPWSYELTYVALLYHTGIAGFLAYGAGLSWMLLNARRIAATGWSGAPALVATMVGTMSFLLANATNPYLEKYDSIWVLFLPIAYINLWRTSARRDEA